MLDEEALQFVRFQHPFTLIIAGPTSSGKTVLTRDILADNRETISPQPENNLRVLWCYGEMQELYKEPIANTDVIYHEGLCTRGVLEELKPDLVVIDDLMSRVSNDKEMVDLFTKTSHHIKISVIFIVQNLFYQTKAMRTISLNAHYFIILRNKRDTQQVFNIGRQMMPDKMKYFARVYGDATKEPFSHLIIDKHPSSPDEIKLRCWQEEVKGNGEKGFVVYAPTEK